MPGRDILIFTNSLDTHACAVERVLQIRGGNPIVINTAHLMVGESVSARYSEGCTKIRMGGFEGTSADVHSSWNRRFSKLFSLPENLHPADRTFVRNNTQSTLTGFLGLIDDRFPVNPLASARYSSNKLLQLQAAKRANFLVPETLISNHIGDIRGFIDAVGDACVKPYHSHGWKTDDGVFQALTVRIGKDDVFDASAFEISPHIYQEYVRKKEEYRVTIFGNFSAAVRIDSQSLDDQSSVDWRSSPQYTSTLEPCELPPDVINSLKKVLVSLGLRFGTFDLARNADGEYVFFEVNEAGQWLWQEMHCPDCRILQPFSEFLHCASDDFSWEPSRRSRECDAVEVLKNLRSDPRFNGQSPDDYPDEEVHVSDERVQNGDG
ncbi:MAG: hypothetical protein JHD35_08270 [Sphingopyxis sp.]|nr:hypothetical protein [Sphingopyxis sp.]